MNLETTKQFILKQGWTPQEKARRKGTLYLYAVRRNRLVEKRMEWRYIAPVSKLNAMTEAEVLAILNREEAS